jgi:hypothetical protein
MKQFLNKRNDERSELISGISKIVEEFNSETAKKILFDNGDSFDSFVGRFHEILNNKDDSWNKSILIPLKKLYNGVKETEPEYFQNFRKFLFRVKKQKDNEINFVNTVNYFKSCIDKQDIENKQDFNYMEVTSFFNLFMDLFQCYGDPKLSSNQKLSKISMNKDIVDDGGNYVTGDVAVLIAILKNENFRTIIFSLESYLSEFIDFVGKKENKTFLIIKRSTNQLMFSRTKVPGDLLLFEFDIQAPGLSFFEFSMIIKKFSSENPAVEFANLIKMKMGLWHESFLKNVLNPVVFTFFDFMENRIPLSFLSDEDILQELLGDSGLTLSELISLLKKLHPEDKERIRRLVLPLF